MAKCPRCGMVGKEQEGIEYINHLEKLHYTHICPNEKCATQFRYDPPTLSTLNKEIK